MVQVTGPGQEDTPAPQEKTLGDVTPAKTAEDISLQLSLKSKDAAEKRAGIEKAMSQLRSEQPQPIAPPEKEIPASLGAQEQAVAMSKRIDDPIGGQNTEVDKSTSSVEVYPPQVGDIVWLNLGDGTVRAAIVTAAYKDMSADMLVFFNGTQDYRLTGKTEGPIQYYTVQRGFGEGQWRPRS